jgi:L-fuculose-phosphate aldolase
MRLHAERQLIAEYGRKLAACGLIRGTGGNLSIFSRSEDLIAISPSGLDYMTITAADVPLVTPAQVLVEGRGKPSTELAMHLIAYARRQDVSAVVHTHSVFATTLACLGWDIPAVHYLIGFAGTTIPCARYATFGTQELAEAAISAMGSRMAVLLANHGVLAVGKDLRAAFTVAEMVEFCAEVYYRAKCVGRPVLIADAEMEHVLEKFKSYGTE